MHHSYHNNFWIDPKTWQFFTTPFHLFLYQMYLLKPDKTGLTQSFHSTRLKNTFWKKIKKIKRTMPNTIAIITLRVQKIWQKEIIFFHISLSINWFDLILVKSIKYLVYLMKFTQETIHKLCHARRGKEGVRHSVRVGHKGFVGCITEQ